MLDRLTGGQATLESVVIGRAWWCLRILPPVSAIEQHIANKMFFCLLCSDFSFLICCWGHSQRLVRNVKKGISLLSLLRASQFPRLASAFFSLMTPQLQGAKTPFSPFSVHYVGQERLNDFRCRWSLLLRISRDLQVCFHF